MNASRLLGVLLSTLAGALAHAAEAPPAKPKNEALVGTVCGRQGNCVILALAQGVTVKPGDELAVGRSTLLIAMAAPKPRTTFWGDWQEAGRIQMRALLGTAHAIALVTADAPRPGAGPEPPPNIRPGDTVYRPAAP